ncbi:MAG: hypothetical protein WCE21_04805 [Candidatus Babeliales bacterium]
MNHLFLLLICVATGTAALHAQQDGTLDPSFGNSAGYVIPTVTNGQFIPYGLAVQTDGKIIIASAAQIDQRISITRLNSDGIPDLTFGPSHTGVVTTSVFLSNAFNVVIQPNGKIIVAGSNVGNNPTAGLVQRFNVDGSPDYTFNGTSIASVTGPIPTRFNACILQADGRIVATGISDNPLLTVRFNQDGSIDTQFVNISLPGLWEGAGLALQADGKILVVVYNPGVMVVRYNTDGSLDTSFGNTSGIALPGVGSFAVVLAVQTDGSIIAGGTDATENNLQVTRLTSNGLLDLSYNNGLGYNATIAGNTGYIGGPSMLSLQADGKLVFGAGNASQTATILVRFNANGTVDSSFGAAHTGVVTVPSGQYISATALQSDGKTVTAGGDPSGTLIQIARYFSSPALVATTVRSPIAAASVNTSIIFTGQAQDPSLVFLLVDGTWIQAGTHTDPNNWSVPVIIKTIGNHTVQAVSIYQDGSLNIASDPITFSVGPQAPSSFTGTITKNEFLNKTECVLQATWTLSVNGATTQYVIAQNGVVLATIPATQPLQFVYCASCKSNAFNGITVSAATANGIAGAPQSLVIS